MITGMDGYPLSDRRTVMLLTYKGCRDWKFYDIITMLQSHIGTLDRALSGIYVSSEEKCEC